MFVVIGGGWLISANVDGRDKLEYSLSTSGLMFFLLYFKASLSLILCVHIVCTHLCVCTHTPYTHRHKLPHRCTVMRVHILGQSSVQTAAIGSIRGVCVPVSGRGVVGLILYLEKPRPMEVWKLSTVVKTE